MAALGGLTLWVGFQALDPAWSAANTDAPWLGLIPGWARGSFFWSIGVLFMIHPGLWMLWAGALKVPIATFDAGGVAARNLFGYRRCLAWSEVTSARSKQNLVVLSPATAEQLSHQIWDRCSVFLDVGMLDALPEQIIALIHRYRPELPWRSEAE